MAAISILYTVNRRLAFQPGGWELSEAGKEEFAGIVHKPGPSQSRPLYVSGFTGSTPIRPPPDAAPEGRAKNRCVELTLNPL